MQVTNDDVMAEVKSRGGRRGSAPALSIVAMKTSGEVADAHIEGRCALYSPYIAPR